MTSILKPAPTREHRAVHILLGLLPTPSSLPPSILNTAMIFRPGSCDTEHPSGSPMDIYVSVSCGHVLLFALSVFHRDDLDFPDHNTNYTVRLG
jgi:hypothetical protein